MLWRTHEIQSSPFSMVSLHSPSVFQTLKVLSREPVMICLLSGEKVTERRSFLWPVRVSTEVPLTKFQSLAVPSHEAVSANWPSTDRQTSSTKWEWPVSLLLGWANSSAVLTMSQMRMLLSLEPVTSTPFLKATEVTQPLWPTRQDWQVAFMLNVMIAVKKALELMSRKRGVLSVVEPVASL